MLRVAVTCAVLVSVWAAEECYDMGVSGTICDKRYCPSEEGVCDGSHCKCVSGYGKAGLLCSNADDFVASIFDDPVVKINNEFVGVPVPCQYLFSDVQMKVKSSNSPNGWCFVRVSLNNQRAGGHFFVGGFQIFAYCRDMNENLGYNGHQIVGYAANAHVNKEGKYCFDLRATHNGAENFNDDLQNRENWIDGAPYTFQVEQTTSLVRLQIPAIGLTAHLRPFDPQYDVANQKWLPGFAVKYDMDKDVKFLSDDEVVFLNPGTSLPQSGDFRSASDELMYRAFYSDMNARGQFPNYSEECFHAYWYFRECKSRDATTTMLSTCRFILDTPDFIKCVSTPDSGEVDKIMSLYNKCLATSCFQHYDSCMQLTSTLQALPTSCQANVLHSFLCLKKESK